MERLKELRKERGMTLDDLSDMVGIHKAQLSRYERGDTSPKPEACGKLAQYFGVTVGYLMGYESEINVERMIDDLDYYVEQRYERLERAIKRFTEKELTAKGVSTEMIESFLEEMTQLERFDIKEFFDERKVLMERYILIEEGNVLEKWKKLSTTDRYAELFARVLEYHHRKISQEGLKKLKDFYYFLSENFHDDLVLNSSEMEGLLQQFALIMRSKV